MTQKINPIVLKKLIEGQLIPSNRMPSRSVIQRELIKKKHGLGGSLKGHHRGVVSKYLVSHGNRNHVHNIMGGLISVRRRMGLSARPIRMKRLTGGKVPALFGKIGNVLKTLGLRAFNYAKPALKHAAEKGLVKGIEHLKNTGNVREALREAGREGLRDIKESDQYRNTIGQVTGNGMYRIQNSGMGCGYGCGLNRRKKKRGRGLKESLKKYSLKAFDYLKPALKRTASSALKSGVADLARTGDVKHALKEALEAGKTAAKRSDQYREVHGKLFGSGVRIHPRRKLKSSTRKKLIRSRRK